MVAEDVDGLEVDDEELEEVELDEEEDEEAALLLLLDALLLDVLGCRGCADIVSLEAQMRI